MNCNHCIKKLERYNMTFINFVINFLTGEWVSFLVVKPSRYTIYYFQIPKCMIKKSMESFFTDLVQTGMSFQHFFLFFSFSFCIIDSKVMAVLLHQANRLYHQDINFCLGVPAYCAQWLHLTCHYKASLEQKEGSLTGQELTLVASYQTVHLIMTDT